MLSFESICREHGLSITPQRVAIYKELLSSLEHPSAIMIYKKVKYYPNISLESIELTFHKIGLAKAVGGTISVFRYCQSNLLTFHKIGLC